MNDIVTHTLSAYKSALDAAANTNASVRTTANDMQNSSPIATEEHPLPMVVMKDANNTISPTSNRRGRAPEKLPLKKALSVRWKDQSNAENAFSDAAISDDEVLKVVESDEDLPVVENSLKTITKKRSPSPPHLDIKEYESRMKKLKTSIGEACKLELKYLNQAKQVRDKRTRMVEKLKHMKRKAQRFSVLNAQRDFYNNNNNSNSSSEMDVVVSSLKPSEGNVITDDDDFVLPPVFQEKSSSKQLSSSSYVDMTQ